MNKADRYRLYARQNERKADELRDAARLNAAGGHEPALAVAFAYDVAGARYREMVLREEGSAP